MSEEEEKAIGQVRLLLAGDISLYIEDDDGGTAYNGIVNKLYNDDLETVLNLINKQQKELETYKKIAEMFGKSLISISGEKTSLEELIDWARKEVENGNNSSSSDKN